MNNNKSGKIAEFLARNIMRFKGYRIVSKNLITGKGTHAGEIDIIALRGRTLVFVEVKKRSSLDNAAYAISESQKQRIIKAAEVFIKRSSSYQDYNLRFDAILIKFPYSFRHIENAWF